MLIIFIVILIYSIIIHEVSHGWVADQLGDPTARLMKRLTLNPLPHIDPIGSIILPLFLIISHAGFFFGWAKPVPFDPYNLKNPRKDAALISLAGPASNLIIALIAAIIARLLGLFGHSALITIGTQIFAVTVVLNVNLAIFNLLPIAPLDGFKIVGGILSEEKAREWYQLERYGMRFLLTLIFVPGFLYSIIGPAINFVVNLLLPMGAGGGII